MQRYYECFGVYPVEFSVAPSRPSFCLANALYFFVRNLTDKPQGYCSFSCFWI